METVVYWQALYIGNYSIMSILATTVYRQLLCQTEPIRPQICTGNCCILATAEYNWATSASNLYWKLLYSVYWQLLCQTGPLLSQICIGNYSILATAVSNWTTSASNLYWQLLYNLYWQLLCQTGPAEMCNTYVLHTIPIQCQQVVKLHHQAQVLSC